MTISDIFKKYLNPMHTKEKLEHLVCNKANLKTGVSRKQSTPKFEENEHLLSPDMHARVRFRWGGEGGGEQEMFVFWKIWHALFSLNTHFEIRPFALVPTISLTAFRSIPKDF